MDKNFNELLEAIKDLMPITENENIAAEYEKEIERVEAAIAKVEGK